MRLNWIWIAVASLVLAPAAASAADVEEALQQMQQRMSELEARLDATTDELDAANERVEQQHELIQRSGIADAKGSSSGLASFLDTLEIGGWLAGSYAYNFAGPDGERLDGTLSSGINGNTGGRTGGGGFAYPFHPDANSFQVDQLWFELEKPVSEDSRAGFRADLVYGKTADILSNGRTDTLSGSDEDLDLYQAYIQYLAPLGPNGVTFKAGKFATLIGAEVTPTVYNFNITRGHVFNLFQPINHVGVLASVESDSGASAAIGVVNNNVSANDVDLNNNKSLMWHLGYGEDTWSASFNGIWGSTDSFARAGTGSNERDKDTILDLILSWDPNEQFSGYINANWREVENGFTDGGSFGACGTASTCKDGDGWGIAAAGRYAINERLGFALRGEYVEDNDSLFSQVSTATAGQETELVSITGTLDYALTEKLMLRGELRYDTVDVDGTGSSRDDVFVSDSNTSAEDDQYVGVVEMIYNF